MNRFARGLVTFAGLLVLWHLAYEVTGRQPYLLPSPWQTAQTLVLKAPLIARHAWVTGLEIVLGLVVGTLLGSLSALCLAAFRPARRWLMPMLVVSQAIPVFAIAPLLLLWLGYGMGSKIAMATLIIYFPVTSAFFDGLRRTDPGWLDLAGVMGGTRWSILWRVRVPAALPSLASGLRVATAVAPIGAVVGEWVGASAGLGYLMLHANARMQVDQMFAALFVLALLAVSLYALMDALLRHWLPWQPDAPPTDP